MSNPPNARRFLITREHVLCLVGVLSLLSFFLGDLLGSSFEVRMLSIIGILLLGLYMPEGCNPREKRR